MTITAIAGAGVLPSQAAVKKKPKPITGSYDVTLPSDPTQDVSTNVYDGCRGVTGKGIDNHPFTVPAAGKLTVLLVSPDPTGKSVTHWALWLMDSDGTTIDKSNGGTSNEQTNTKFKKKTTFELQVCNLAGTTSGHISYVFKYA